MDRARPELGADRDISAGGLVFALGLGCGLEVERAPSRSANMIAEHVIGLLAMLGQQAPGLDFEMVDEISTQRLASGERAMVRLFVKQKQKPGCFQSSGREDERVSRDGQAPAIDASGLDALKTARGVIDNEAGHGRVEPDRWIRPVRDRLTEDVGDIAPSKCRPFRPSRCHVLVTAAQRVVGNQRRRRHALVGALIQPKQALDFRDMAVEFGHVDRPTAQAEIVPRPNVVGRERHHPAAPGVRRAAQSANTAGDGGLVRLRRLLDDVERVDFAIGSSPAALEDNHAALRGAEPVGRNQTRDAAADDAHAAIRSWLGRLREVTNHVGPDSISCAPNVNSESKL